MREAVLKNTSQRVSSLLLKVLTLLFFYAVKLIEEELVFTFHSKLLFHPFLIASNLPTCASITP